ncbi:MAG: PD-(D/E)XK motif protein [Flaviflexus sp.]|uniref:PD-(D/E)XK motif protein n=1 Tax=Flaviflexus sp. TaxID=1969482 RepID=UPI003F8ECFED
MTGYDRVRQAFEALDGASAGRESMQTIAIGSTADPGDIRLGKDDAGNIHLLIVSPPGFARLEPKLGPVFPAEWESLVSKQGEEIWFLNIGCKDRRLLHTFHSLVGELVDRVEKSGRRGVIELFEVIESWRRALERASRQLSRSLEIGLFGELLVLQELASIRPEDALRAWRGVDNYRHDFSLRNAVEVKAYTGAASPSVQIHGVRQLDPPLSGALTLVTFHLEEMDSGRSLEDLIDEIGQVLPISLIREKLEGDLPSKELRRFEVVEQRIYEVDNSFPGIRESASPAHSLLGIDELTYRLLLDVCPPPNKQTSLTEILQGL